MANIDPQKIYFSPSTLSFYLGRHFNRHGGSWPKDAAEVSQETFRKYSADPPQGKVRGANNNQPVWVDPVPFSEDKAAELLNFRVDFALNALAKDWGYTKGIDNATTWVTSSNPQFAAEARALAEYRDAVWAWVCQQPKGKHTIDGMPAAPVRPLVKGA